MNYSENGVQPSVVKEKDMKKVEMKDLLHLSEDIGGMVKEAACGELTCSVCYFCNEWA